MKEFFSVDLHKQYSESSKIIERSLSNKLLNAQEEYTQKMKEYEKKAQTPSVLSLVKTLSSLIGIFLLMVFFANLTQLEGVSDVKANHWLIFGFGMAFFALGFTLSILSRRRAKKVAKDQGYHDLLKQGETIFDQCLKDLKVPQTAKEIDLFLYIYTTKSGTEKPATKMFNYVNTPVRVFVENEKVMIADLQNVFALDKKCFKSFEIIEEKKSFNAWNKEIGITSNEYKEFGIKANSMGIFWVKNCVKVILEREGEQFSIVIPPYDGDTFLKLCGLKKGK